MTAQTHLLQKAITFCRAGDCDTARRLLLGILRTDESNQAAWIWYGETFLDLEERLGIYERALMEYPQMQQVRRAYRRSTCSPEDNLAGIESATAVIRAACKAGQ
jgi:hypothetical protein